MPLWSTRLGCYLLPVLSFVFAGGNGCISMIFTSGGFHSCDVTLLKLRLGFDSEGSGCELEILVGLLLLRITRFICFFLHLGPVEPAMSCNDTKGVLTNRTSDRDKEGYIYIKLGSTFKTEI